MIIGVHLPTKLELFKVRQALDCLRLGLRPREGGQKQTGQDRDDRDDNQQLNEGEGPSEAASCECAGCHLVAKCGALTKRRYILRDRPECGFGFYLLFAFVLQEAVMLFRRSSKHHRWTIELRFAAHPAASVRDVASSSVAARSSITSPPALTAARAFPSGEKFSDQISSGTPRLPLVNRLRTATSRRKETFQSLME
jgi:hypothetical protein